MSDADEDKVCNNCKRDIPAANLDLHLSHCIKNLRLCTLCDDPIPIRQFEEHLKEEHAELECSKCKGKYQQGNEDQHESVCPEAAVLCDFCKTDYPRRALPAHVDACGSRTEECEGCGDRVMLRDLLDHVCRPRREVPSTRLGVTSDVTRTSTSPYALQPLNTDMFRDNFQHNGIGADYLDELIATEHFNPLNGSAVDLDAALAAQIAHDEERRHVTNFNNHVTPPNYVTPPNQFTPPFPSHTVTRTQRPRSNDSESMMLPCEFCEAMFPIEDLILHQTGCIENSITISNPAVTQSHEVNEAHDSFIPCEFCCKQFPLSLITQHQAGCTPTRRGPTFPENQDDRPIRGTVHTALQTPNLGTRAINLGPSRSNTSTRTNNPTAKTAVRTGGRHKPNVKPTLSKHRVPPKNNHPVLPESSTSGEQNNHLSINGERTNSRTAVATTSETRGIRKELVPKPKMTLSSAGKEPVKVKNNRVPKTNNMNDLGKASTSRSIPSVVVPKRRPGANSQKKGANFSSSDNNGSETWSALSPKIINKNPRSFSHSNGDSISERKHSNGKESQNNFPGASKKTASSKDFKIKVSSSENERVRANILNKYQKNKRAVVSGSNSKSDENT